MEVVALSRAQARRVTLAAQGFADRPHATPTLRTLDRTLRRTGVLQIDSVNVLQRAHLVPPYSRMGPFDPDLLRRAAEERPRRVVEYWAHAAAFMPVDLWPFMRFRQDANRRAGRAIVREEPVLVASVLAQVRDRGPSTARDLEAGLPRTREHWGWNWSDTKHALEYLFAVGDLTVAGRNDAFERRYDLPERVLPPGVLEAPVPSAAETHRELVRRAASSHGVATVRCLADYYRMRVSEVRPAVRDLVEAGELLPARVEGWEVPAYLHRDAARPRRVSARTLLSPFDPLIWERERTERLWDFHYRIEIYVPEARRRHGYYVLPFLLDEQLAARVDLKADRAAGTLLVRGAYAETSAPDHTAAALAEELVRLAGWLGLEAVVVEPCGDLAPALAQEVGR
ncbi:MAG: crosslink repair DNA glycosylase YcaQ family protein [Nocardioides sp.]|nr:crosslink repair DNA glycosylase YcaQ family protein [Nocardioides sp.]